MIMIYYGVHEEETERERESDSSSRLRFGIVCDIVNYDSSI